MHPSFVSSMTLVVCHRICQKTTHSPHSLIVVVFLAAESRIAQTILYSYNTSMHSMCLFHSTSPTPYPSHPLPALMYFGLFHAIFRSFIVILFDIVVVYLAVAFFGRPTASTTEKVCKELNCVCVEIISGSNGISYSDTQPGIHTHTQYIVHFSLPVVVFLFFLSVDFVSHYLRALCEKRCNI